LIVALLVNADLVVVTVNVGILSIEDIITIITGAKSIVVTDTPYFAMTNTRISWRVSVL
jgi:hypothetical protein